MIKICQNCKKDFIIDTEDFIFYEKIQVPAPTFCPDCRLVRRLAVRNERTLYKRICPKCSKNVISIYAPESPHTVYCNPCWWKDDWDPMTYGREYDFNRPFFEQFNELYNQAPLSALHTLYQTLENSEYVNMAGHLKNCYLLFNSDYDENCSYGTEIEHSKECYDNIIMEECELSYGNVNGEKSYNVFFSTDIETSHDIWFSKNLSGCSSCFGCVNLRNKKYHIFNEPYSKEEYETKIKELYNGSHKSIQEIQEKTKQLFLSVPYKYMHEKQNRNVTGDYVYYSDDVKECYVTVGSQHCRYCLWMLVKPVKDCWDFSEYGDNCERVYEVANSGIGLTDVKFSFFCVSELSRVEYCIKSYTSSDIFGCVSVRNKKYCVLNKQYTKEEYEALLPKIKQHMNDMPYIDAKGRKYRYGEFFPIELSAHGYNETTAQEHTPLTKEEALSQGYEWRNTEDKTHKVTRKWNELPDTIADINDNILKEIILCRAWDESKDEAIKHNCSQAFRITQNELNFYRRMNIPIPEQCPNTRHHERLKRRNPFKLWKRICQCAGETSDNQVYTNTSQTHKPHAITDHCPNEFETAYSSDRPEIIYCKECYQAEVI